ncbi:MAG: Tfp pilus assembly protein FimT/FimU [Candidatus Xenobiia bacterium LiM19]
MKMPGSEFGKRQSRRGFSLIELMVVLGLFGILIAIGVPNLMKFRATSAGYQCARTLVADIEETRNLSLRTENPAYITFSSTDNRYDIYYYDESKGADRLYKRVQINKDFGASVSLDTGTITEIRFVSQGFVNTSSSTETIKVKSGGVNYSVVVTKNGKCHVKEG